MALERGAGIDDMGVEQVVGVDTLCCNWFDWVSSAVALAALIRRRALTLCWAALTFDIGRRTGGYHPERMLHRRVGWKFLTGIHRVYTIDV